MASYDPVIALTRGLEVLKSLNELGPASVGELHQATSIAKPTIVRMLETLVHAGYVHFLPQERQYQVTARVLLLSNGYELQHQLIRLARPVLNDYRQRVGWPIELGVFDQDAMVILDTSRDADTFSVVRKAGSRLPVLSSALGRAYLSALPDEALRQTIDQLLVSQKKEDGSTYKRAEIVQVINNAKALGYGCADRTLASNACAIAAVIRMNGKPIGSVNIASHVAELPLESLKKKHGHTVQVLAEDISTALRTT